jgi:hypothetical protein
MGSPGLIFTTPILSSYAKADGFAFAGPGFGLSCAIADAENAIRLTTIPRTNNKAKNRFIRTSFLKRYSILRKPEPASLPYIDASPPLKVFSFQISSNPQSRMTETDSALILEFGSLDSYMYESENFLLTMI